MFSCDVDPSIESTSWKVSQRALIVRNEVLVAFGGIDPSFDSPSGAALEAGLRWINRGALVRHVPDLLPDRSVTPPDSAPSAADGIRIVQRHLGTKWALWAVARGLRTGAVPVHSLPRAVRSLRRAATAGVTGDAPDGLPAPAQEASDPLARVTVLVPTVGRYDYLEELLRQLDAQTRRPDEVIVVDQNPEEERRDLAAIAPDLPLRVLHLLPPGQCTARNTGLRAATGTHVLFLDDDDEIPPDLIEQHLKVLSPPEVAVSCGLIDDRESGPAPASEQFRKASSVFPTNNTMIRREVLEASGLFDPTYDRGARADHDLGMRSYLAGNLHVHDPRPKVFHHHAPMGGLRTHGARVRTRGNSRSTLTERHLRTPTDIYLGLRYYSADRVDDDLALSVFSTLGGSGPATRRLLRALVQMALLPANWAASTAARRDGERLYLERPELPTLDDGAS
jgi:glycosyltransferase involved in cell wall biosynthesis